jgi:hypothetical protein
VILPSVIMVSSPRLLFGGTRRARMGADPHGFFRRE